MVVRYRKPNMSLLRSGGFSRAVGDVSASPSFVAKPRRVHGFAKQRLSQQTAAECQFDKILNTLGDGALRGKFIREWAFKNWILDFYLYEIRVGIEIDGEYHALPIQRERDGKKTGDCEAAGITLLRISNADVFGDREALVSRLRVAYKEGLSRSRRKPK